MKTQGSDVAAFRITRQLDSVNGHNFSLAKFQFCDGLQTIEMRYKKFDQDVGDLTVEGRITDAIRESNGFGNFSPETPLGSSNASPAGKVSTATFDKPYFSTTKVGVASTVYNRRNFAHFFLSSYKGATEAALQRMLATLRFSVGNAGDPSTVVGGWRSQGGGISLEADGTFQEYTLYMNWRRWGTYRVVGSQILFTYHGKRSQELARPESETCAYSLTSNLTLRCGTNVIEYHQ